MMHCMDVWESDPDTYAYNSVGYLTASFEPMRAGLETIYERHQQLGYPSTLVTGCLLYTSCPWESTRNSAFCSISKTVIVLSFYTGRHLEIVLFQYNSRRMRTHCMLSNLLSVS